MNTTNKIIILLVALPIVILGFSFLSIYSPQQETQQEVVNSPTITGKWVWRDTVMQSEEVVSPAEGKEEVFTIEFTKAGEVRGTTDCNSFSGSYKVDGQNIVFGPIASTEMFCEASQQVLFVDFVSRSNTYTFDVTGHLILVFKDDAGAMILEKSL